MEWEINVGREEAHGRSIHFFATHPRSLTSKEKVLEVYRELKKRFPASEGYVIDVRYNKTVSHWETAEIHAEAFPNG